MVDILNIHPGAHQSTTDVVVYTTDSATGRSCRSVLQFHGEVVHIDVVHPPVLGDDSVTLSVDVAPKDTHT